MGVVLALMAALAYGASDFMAGVASRRVAALPVSVLAGATALVTVSATLPFLSGHGLDQRAFWYGALAGIGGAVGTLMLYRGLAAGQMSVVAPLSAVGAAAVPVIVGLATGERPSALALTGLLLALPAIGLISTTPGGGGERRAGMASGVLDGLAAGCGFGLLFVGLGKAGSGSGLWANAVEQLVALLILLGLAGARRVPLRLPAGARLQVVAVGVLGGAATSLFLVSTHHGLLSVSAVLTSLYPASTVLLAWLLLRERLSRPQLAGLGWAATAVVLIALG
ncbi:MAG: EamA family transporter [Mycobacteriales bacterium]